MENLPPLWMLKYLPNMLACHVTIIHGAEGPSNTITCAEASALLSLGESMRVIERGAADACFSGGAESKMSLMGVVRLGLAGRLAPTQESNESPARPYDPQAQGTVPGEAGALLVLEEQESAQRRGAKVYARLAGFGAAHSGGSTIPPYFDDGVPEDGLELAIRRALDDAKISPEDVDAIIPQGCGVRALDSHESVALRAVFGERLAKVPVVTLVPFIGDCAAGHGGILAGVAALCLKHQQLPARLHAGRYPSDLDVGPTVARTAPLRNVLVCSSSLGGQNAALVLQYVA
jgi:3-oxoacyl-[acyl-carrier-protein] synthase II